MNEYKFLSQVLSGFSPPSQTLNPLHLHLLPFSNSHSHSPTNYQSPNIPCCNTLLNPNCISSSNGPDSDQLGNDAVLWPWIGSKIDGSIVWDGVYFARIAQCGYEYEHTYAFLLLFPICMRVLSYTGVLEGYIIYFPTLHRTYDAILHRKSAFAAIKFLILGVLRSVCIFVPFVAFQAYGYYNICLGRKPDEISPWCSARVPLLYNYIQSRYWGVGFLRYFQLKQLPNFLLASPILFLAICSVVHFMRLRPSLFISLGFKASNEEKNELFSSTAGQRLNVDSPSKSPLHSEIINISGKGK
ncbi:unnamed protein product [Rhodiola kirilowii]